MKKYSIIILMAVVALGACKAKKAEFFGNTSDSTANATNTNPAPSATDSIRFTVSFYSPGSGINYMAARKLDSFIANYQTNNNVTLTVYKTPWGREGEVDYCFNLSNMDSKKADALVQQVKDLLKGEDRINYKENTPCRELRVIPGGN